MGTGSKGNCYVLTDRNGGRLMLEAGMPVIDVLKAVDFDTSRMAGVLLTHEHGDHAYYADAWVKRGQLVYASKGTIDAVGKQTSVAWKSNAIRLAPKQLTAIGSYRVKPFAVQHDAKEPFGYLIGHDENKILFLTDAGACNVKTKHINTFMIECNYDTQILQESDIPEQLKARIYKSHFSLTACKDFLRNQDLSECRNIVIIHCSNERSDKEKFVREIQALTGKPVTIAENGLEIEL